MLKKSVIGVIAASVILAVLRTAIVVNNMETNLNNRTYYLLDNFQTKAFAIFAVAFIPLLFVLALFFSKGKKAVLEINDSLSLASSCTLAFILFGTFVIFAQAYFKDAQSIAKMGLPVAIFSVLSGGAFLFAGLSGKGQKLLAFFTLFPMVFTLFRILSDFLATASAPFANSGGYHLMGLSVFLLYLLCEGKAHLSKGSAFFFYGYGFASIFLLLIFALPNLVLHCVGFGVFSFDYGAALSVVDIVAAFYIAARLNSAKLIALTQE